MSRILKCILYDLNVTKIRSFEEFEGTNFQNVYIAPANGFDTEQAIPWTYVNVTHPIVWTVWLILQKSDNHLQN